MTIFRGRSEIRVPGTGSAVAIGTFDGVHLGHRSLISGTVAAARAGDLASGIITWDRHPLATLRPDEVPPLLTSLDRKLELLEKTGVDFILVLPFDEEFAAWPPERFIDEIVVQGLRAHAVRVGYDWRFGHRAAGDTDLLAKLGAEHGFDVDAVQLEEARAEPVSSTRIRAAIHTGNMESVRELLTRPFDVDGVVVRGDGRGATLGFPTANLGIDRALARPAQGVYAGRLRVQGTWFRAAVNVGKNLTFGGETVRVEAYILDFERDIYGESVRLEFWTRLRDELKFDSVDALIQQMRQDVEDARDLIPAP